jgi:hypothetical protein
MIVELVEPSKFNKRDTQANKHGAPSPPSARLPLAGHAGMIFALRGHEPAVERAPPFGLPQPSMQHIVEEPGR